MRTTVTLDPDVAEQLKALARCRDVSFTTVLNDAVRKGLASERGESKPYRVPSRPLGVRPRIELTHALSLADTLEDDEILRKLELRK